MQFRTPERDEPETVETSEEVSLYPRDQGSNAGAGARAEKARASREMVQRFGGNGRTDPAATQKLADHGVSGNGGQLPHAEAIQKSFGPKHDISGVRAHVGGGAAGACDAIGAEAYATGHDLAFKQQPSLWLAAHETAHVVQQRRGVQLHGGVGRVDDEYERNADAVADRVVKGESAADLLGPASDAQKSDAVQTKAVQKRSEKWEQIKRVGPLDAWRAKKDADTALRAAKASGLPGLWNGPGDAFRHCYWNCLMTRSIGAGQAKTVADTHEEFGKNHPNERRMDDHNNEMGRQGAKSFPNESCEAIAMKLLRSGKLKIIPNYKEVARTGGKTPPKAPVPSNTVPIPKVDDKNISYGKNGYGGNNYN